MSQPDDPSISGDTPEALPKAAPIGHLAIGGMAWSTALTLATKVISVAQQLIIARYFLSGADFGLVALGQVVISLTAIGQNLGLSEIMARRPRTFERWAQAAIWMSLAGSLVCIALIMALIPLWEPVYRSVTGALGRDVSSVPQIQGLIAIWCLGLPFDAVATIFNARLRADMRFRVWAAIASTQTIGIAVLSIILASLGWGAYALIVPVPVMMMACCFLSRYFSGQRMRLRPHFHRWGALLRDARYFFPGNEFNVLLQQGDFLITGLFFRPELLGAYYFAFRMSAQTSQLISANLTTVLVPSFARLDQERARQFAAYERTTSAILLLGIPLCCLQALLAAPVFHLLFSDGKWNDAIRPFEILSLAMGFAMPMSTALSLLVAQGRLRMNMILTIAQSLLFVTLVIIGARLGSVDGVALFVGLFYLVLGPMIVAVPLLRTGASALGFLLRIYWFPAVTGAVAVAAGWMVPSFLRIQNNWALLGLRLMIWLSVVSLLLWIIRPPAFREVGPRAASYLARLVPARWRK